MTELTRSQSDWKRKAVHVGTGLFALALRWLDWKGAALLAATALAFNLVLLPRFGKGIYRDRSARWDLGIVSYPLAVLLLILLFRHQLAVAAAVWGMLAFGDPAAAVAGKSFGRSPLPWNRDKTWAGLAANLAVGGIAGILLFRWVSTSPPPLWGTAVLVGALVFALLESLRAGVEDNLVAPLPAALAVHAILASGATAWLAAWRAPAFLSALTLAAAVNVALAVVTRWLGAVSGSGAVAGAILGTIILSLGGWGPYAVLWAFFLGGTLATRLGYATKKSRGVAQKRQGRRGAEHAVANCSVAAAILLVSAGFRPDYPEVVLAGFAGAFAAALADTLATEVGGLYGRRAYSPLGLRPVGVGMPGAVSWPGTLAALGGGALIAGAAVATGILPASLWWTITAAGFLGSLAESAANDLARSRDLRLDHDFANGFNTFVGALVAMVLASGLQKGALYIPIERG